MVSVSDVFRFRIVFCSGVDFDWTVDIFVNCIIPKGTMGLVEMSEGMGGHPGTYLQRLLTIDPHRGFSAEGITTGIIGQVT